MSLYGLYFRNPPRDLIFLLHMERADIGVVQWRLIFVFFSWKLKFLQKLKTCDMLHQDFYVDNFRLVHDQVSRLCALRVTFSVGPRYQKWYLIMFRHPSPIQI